MAKEIKKGENWRRGYMTGYHEGVEETKKAYGGCDSCYGKGYSTAISFMEGGHGRSHFREQMPLIRFCKCPRGRQLEAHWGAKAA